MEAELKMLGFTLGIEGFGTLRVVAAFKSSLALPLAGVSTNDIQIVSMCDDEGCSSVYDTTFSTRRASLFLTVEFRIVSEQAIQLEVSMSSPSYLLAFTSAMLKEGFDVQVTWTKVPVARNQVPPPTSSVNNTTAVVAGVVTPLLVGLLILAAWTACRYQQKLREEDFETPFAYSRKGARSQRRMQEYTHDNIASDVGFPPQKFIQKNLFTSQAFMQPYPIERVELELYPFGQLPYVAPSAGNEASMWDQRGSMLVRPYQDQPKPPSKRQILPKMNPLQGLYGQRQEPPDNHQPDTHQPLSPWGRPDPPLGQGGASLFKTDDLGAPMFANRLSGRDLLGPFTQMSAYISLDDSTRGSTLGWAQPSARMVHPISRSKARASVSPAHTGPQSSAIGQLREGWHMCDGCGNPVKDAWPRCPSCRTAPSSILRQVAPAQHNANVVSNGVSVSNTANHPKRDSLFGHQHRGHQHTSPQHTPRQLPVLRSQARSSLNAQSSAVVI